MTLIRDLIDRLPETLVRRALAAAAPLVLAATALVFLTVAGFSLLVRQIGLPGAALCFSALFAVLALAAAFLGQARAERRRRQAAEAQARLAGELAAARALLDTAGSIPAIAAFLAAFALARRR